jgi:hypothetical protein
MTATALGLEPRLERRDRADRLEHSLKNELILGRRVHREHREARKELHDLLTLTGVRSKIGRALFP